MNQYKPTQELDEAEPSIRLQQAIQMLYDYIRERSPHHMSVNDQDVCSDSASGKSETVEIDNEATEIADNINIPTRNDNETD